MKTDAEELREVGLVIDEPGFKIVEELIDKQMKGVNNLGRITGHPFDDGVRKGEVDGLKYSLRLFSDLRKELKRMKGES